MAILLGLTITSCVTPGGRSLSDWEAYLEQGQFSGTVLVAREDRVLEHWGMGFADCRETVPVATDTVFAIGSITKTFTEVAIGMLVDDGAIELDAPIARYLNDVPEDKRSITVRQLVEHRSGLSGYHDGALGDFEVIDQSEALGRILGSRLLSRPGSRYRYSNSGYTLLAVIIERASGLSYVDYLRGRVFGPSGMNSTGFWGETFPAMAATDTTVVGCGTPEDWVYSWTLVGNGGMVSTTEDLLRFVDSLTDGTLLTPRTMSAMGFDSMINAGFGWAGGSSQHGLAAAMEYDGPTRTLVVVVSNRSESPGESFARSLMRSAVSASR